MAPGSRPGIVLTAVASNSVLCRLALAPGAIDAVQLTVLAAAIVNGERPQA